MPRSQGRRASGSPPARSAIGWQALLLLGLRVVVLVSVIVGVPGFPSAAANRFHEIAHSPAIPYRDFAVEYPIGELFLIQIVGSSSQAVARALLAVLAFGADVLAYGTVRRRWGSVVALRYLFLGTPLLFFIYRRSDLVGVALAVLGIVMVSRGREGAGGASLGAAVLVKLWPVVLAPALVIERRVRAIWMLLAVVASGLAAWIALGGVRGVTQVTSFRGASGWELESTVGAVVWALTGEHRFEQGANRTGVVPGWARALLAGALLLILAAVWFKARRRAHDVAGAPALVAVAALLLLSPVLSPQYIAWLLPWGAIASVDGRRWLLLAAAPCLFTGAIVASWYLDLHLGPGWNQILLILRNATLLPIPIAWLALCSDRSHVRDPQT